jgi:hypothetical protein
MNRVLMLVLVLGAAIPAVAQAQYGYQPAPAHQALQYGGGSAQPAAQLPVTLDFSLPGESQWVQQINDNKPQQQNPPGVAALNAQVNTAGQPAQPGADGNGCCANGCDNLCQKPCWPPPGIFEKRTWELEYVTSWWPSITHVPGAPTSFVPEIVRLGMMWNDSNACKDRWRGSFEGIIEMDCLPIVEGPGNIIIGGSLLLRYNWGWRTKRFVPYFQLGGGGMYTDAYLFPNSPTGTGFNFILQLGAGGHYFVNNTWAMTTEVTYFHMSNAGMGGDLGYNVAMLTLGITHYFGNCNDRSDR